MMTWGKRKKKPERIPDWDEKLAPYLGKNATITVTPSRVLFDFGAKKVALVNKVVGKEKRVFAERGGRPMHGSLVDVQIVSALQESPQGEAPVRSRCVFKITTDNGSSLFDSMCSYSGDNRAEGNFRFDLVEVKNG